MSPKIYLHLLIVCGTLCQGIIAKFPGENTTESSDFLVRKRRVINHLYSIAERIENANYMVIIQEDNRAICAGVILSQHIVLTAANCVRYELAAYKVLSGGGYSFRAQTHTITLRKQHFGNLPHQDLDGIALIKIDPPFEFGTRTGIIRLYEGLLPAGDTVVTVYGWGRMYPPQPAPSTHKRRVLISINLPIMNHGECHNIYQGNFTITDKHICTYCPYQYCARSDAGAPLVLNHMLVGIHIYKGERENQRNPDVFLDLRRNDYREWIRENMLLH